MCERHLTDEERANEPAGPGAFVDELVVALTNARIYAAGHPRVETAIDALETSLRRVLAAHPGPRVQFGVADGYVFFQTRPLLGASLSAGKLIELLGRLDAGGLSFESTTDRDDLLGLVNFVAREAKNVESHDVANRALDRVGCTLVRFLPPYREAAGGRGQWTDKTEAEMGTALGGEFDLDLESALDIQVPARLYQDVVSVLQDAMVQTCKGDHIDTAPALGYVESVLSRLTHDTTSLMRLAR
ncbi:MAG: hypothetical protein O2894_12410 [Planctomycetota bacterium]|nr:hypothetical protein [Planctomycetota bacterium]